MTTKTPPKEWDRHAQVVARSIASLDRARLPGSTTQFTAIIHEAIVDAMMMAEEDTRGAEAARAAAARAELQDVRGAVAEFRAQRRDSYPHEAVAVLLDAIEQMAGIVERAVSAPAESRTCAKTQTREVLPC